MKQWKLEKPTTASKAAIVIRRRHLTFELATFIACLAVGCFHAALVLDYPYATAEPQKTGWPLTDEERTFVLKPEHERRPGSEQNKRVPAL